MVGRLGPAGAVQPPVRAHDAVSGARPMQQGRPLEYNTKLCSLESMHPVFLGDSMNLNDPFGRVRDKQQRNYLALRESLRHAGVATREQAELLKTRTLRRAWSAVLGVTLVAVAIFWLLPALGTVSVVVAALAWIWVWTTVLMGHRHIERYIKEDLQD